MEESSITCIVRSHPACSRAATSLLGRLQSGCLALDVGGIEHATDVPWQSERRHMSRLIWSANSFVCCVVAQKRQLYMVQHEALVLRPTGCACERC